MLASIEADLKAFWASISANYKSLGVAAVAGKFSGAIVTAVVALFKAL